MTPPETTKPQVKLCVGCYIHRPDALLNQWKNNALKSGWSVNDIEAVGEHFKGLGRTLEAINYLNQFIE